FSGRVARGEPVRLPALWPGLTQNIVKVGVITVAGLASFMILLVNLRFYLMMQVKSNPYLFTVLAALDGWLLIIIGLFTWPLLCTVCLPGPSLTLKGELYRTLTWIILLPSVWLFVGICGAILLWAAFLTKLGLLIYVPLMVVLAQSAAFLSVQYIDFLSE